MEPGREIGESGLRNGGCRQASPVLEFLRICAGFSHEKDESGQERRCCIWERRYRCWRSLRAVDYNGATAFTVAAEPEPPLAMSRSVYFTALLILLAGCQLNQQQPEPVVGVPYNPGMPILPADRLGQPVLDIPEETHVLESVFNSIPNYEPLYNFTDVNRYRRLGSAIGRLDILLVDKNSGQEGVSFCTATIISDRYLLTNYHCIPGMDPALEVQRAVFRAGYLDEEAATGDVFEVGIQPVESNRGLDYAVVEVQGNPSARYGRIPLSVRDPDPREELFIIHHPKGMTQRLTRRNCRLIASTTAVTQTEVRHRCDTFGGSSGSLIFSDNNDGDNFVVVGIHFAGFFEDSPIKFNRAKRMTAVLKESPLLRQIASSAPAIAQNPSPSTSPIASGLALNNTNNITLVPPSLIADDPDIPDDSAPVFTAFTRRISFEWGIKQIYSFSEEGFESLKDFGQPSSLGDFSSKVNLPQYSSRPSDNCAVNDESSLQSGARAWVYCVLGAASDYEAMATGIRNTFPVITQVIADDERGMAVRFADGTAICVDKNMGSLAAVTGHDQAVSMQVWSAATASATCFKTRPVELK